MSDAVRFLLILGIAFSATEAISQQLGLLPPKTKWRQLQHDSVHVIFPAGREETAKRVASLILKGQKINPVNPHSRFRRAPVLLQPYTNVSNGYVSLPPFRSEYYLQPYEDPFQLGSIPWADLLAIHETRHVQQVNAANVGITHLIKSIFGDYGFGFMYALALPAWYREGDAVMAETRLTPQGRGRLSYFSLPFREVMKKEKPWTFLHAWGGSYKYVTPNQYTLGYMMIRYGNSVFGEAGWDSIFCATPRFRSPLAPIGGEIKSRYCKSVKDLYQDALGWHASQWSSTGAQDIAYPHVTIPEKDAQQDFFEMTYPDVDSTGNIYASIQTFDRTTAIYRITPEGLKQKIVSPGIQQDVYFDHSVDKLVWTELRYDARWQRKDKNVIVVYDLPSKQKKQILPVKGYFMPALDHAGRRIVALHSDNEENHQLHILDAQTGRIISELPNPGNVYLGYPCFSADGLSIIATARDNLGQMALVEQHIQSGAITAISPYGYSVLGRPVVHGPWILIDAGLDELDQVYAFDKREGIFYQVSSSLSAHYHPAWDPVQQNVLCSEYRLDGKKLVRLPGSPGQWKKFHPENGIRQMSAVSGRNILAEPPEPIDFTIKKYSPWSSMINLHSWTPTWNDDNAGIAIYSDDIMQRMTLLAGYEYNSTTQEHGPYLEARLGMWFPEIFFGARRSTVKGTLTANFHTIDYKTFQNEAYAGLAVPLIFTPGVFAQSLYLSSQYTKGSSLTKFNFPQLPELESDYHYLRHRAVFSNRRLKAYRPFMTAWGQRVEMSYAHNFSGPVITQLFSSVDLALPGIRPAHYGLVQAEFLQQDTSSGSIRIGSNYTGARGIGYAGGKNQYRLGVTYGFPLLYPDTGISGLIYTRRVRMHMFYDMAWSDLIGRSAAFMQSAGAEVIVDFDFVPVSVGVRYSRLLSGYTGKANVFEFIIPFQRF